MPLSSRPSPGLNASRFWRTLPRAAVAGRWFTWRRRRLRRHGFPRPVPRCNPALGSRTGVSSGFRPQPWRRRWRWWLLFIWSAPLRPRNWRRLLRKVRRALPGRHCRNRPLWELYTPRRRRLRQNQLPGNLVCRRPALSRQNPRSWAPHPPRSQPRGTHPPFRIRRTMRNFRRWVPPCLAWFRSRRQLSSNRNQLLPACR